MITIKCKKLMLTAMATLVAIAANAYSFAIKDIGGSINSTVDFSVSINNETAISAFECQFVLPEGLEFKKDNVGDFEFSLSNRADKSHYVMSNQTAKGVVKVASYSPSSSVFSGNEGELFTGKLLLIGKPGKYEVLVNDILVVAPNGTEYSCNNAKFTVTITEAFTFNANNINGVQTSSVKMPVFLNNATSISAFECEIELPAGVDFCKTTSGEIEVSFGGRQTTSHALLTNVITDMKVKIAAYSSQSKNFAGDSGELFSVNLQLKGEPGDYYATLKNISVVSEIGMEYECADVMFKISIREIPNTDNILLTEDVTTKASRTVLIPVYLTNKVDVYGVQCDIYLSSEDLSITKDTKGRYVFVQNEERVDGQTPSSKLQSDGAVRYMLADYTAENPFSGKDGELFYISMDIPEGIEGDYSVMLKNITLATENDKILCPDITSKITVKTFTLGDVDDDGVIDVQDVLRTAQLVLNSSYNIAADMDEDGLIDVQDVIKVARAVLEQDAIATTSMNAKARVNNKNNLSDYLSISSSTDATLAVNLNNNEEYHGIQMDIELPEGYSFTQDGNGNTGIITNKINLSGCTVMQKQMSNNKMRVIAFANGQNIIKTNIGELFRITVCKDMQMLSNYCDVSISNVILSQNLGKVRLDDLTCSVPVADATNIDNITRNTNEENIYSLDGKKIMAPSRNSIYIINGKKIIIR